MQLRDLSETVSDIDRMALRRWRRDVIEGKIASVPQFFKPCLFYETDDRIEIAFQIIDNVCYCEFHVDMHSVDIPYYSIHSSEPVSFNNALVHLFGKKFLTWDRTTSGARYDAYSYHNAEFNSWVINTVRPWCPFIAYANRHQQDKFDYLKYAAGRKIDQRELLALNGDD